MTRRTKLDSPSQTLAPSWCIRAGCYGRRKIQYTSIRYASGREGTRLVDPSIIDDITKRLSDAVPESARSLRHDLEKNFREVLNSAFNRMNLVTREELEIQEQVLARTREKIDAFESRTKELESLLKERQGTPQDVGTGQDDG